MEPRVEWTPAQWADATKQMLAMLRKQADLVLEQLAVLDEAAEHLDCGGPGVGRPAKDALVQHSLDCSIKLGWAAKAVAMYRKALELSDH
jgi:hypothetical protein